MSLRNFQSLVLVELQISIMCDVVLLIVQIWYEFLTGFPVLTDQRLRKRTQHLFRDRHRLRCKWVVGMKVVQSVRILQIALDYIAGGRIFRYGHHIEG